MAEHHLPMAADVHRAIGHTWPAVLAGLGIDEAFLVNRHGPCPACGGTDRYRFDNRDGKGTWICSKCGAGDAFKLLMHVHGWSFSDTLKAVASHVGLSNGAAVLPVSAPRPVAQAAPEAARPTARVRTLVRTAAAPEDVPCSIAYLRSRRLWPLPSGCSWRAHPAVDFFQAGEGKAVEHVGRFVALVAPVRDVDGELITCHLTYLENGKKLAGREARKLLSPVKGRVGCAVRLLPLNGDTLGIGEGIETCLSASVLNSNVPTWAALNTSLLAKFVPPPEVRHLLVFADRDAAGMEAAWRLRDALDGRCSVDLRLPPAQYADWNDALVAEVRP